MSSQKAKGKQVIDPVDDDNELSADESGGSEPDQPTNEPGPQTSSSKKKKKKKKKSKLARILNPSGAAEDKLVETVLEKVKAEHADADEATVRAALQQLKLKDVISGKSGLGGKNQKDTGGHKVRSCRVFLCLVY
jgi:glycylpeptide N-tetradecanoyltransferase